MFGYFALLNAEPVGYVQSYDATSVGDGWWPDAQPGTWGIDQFLANEKDLGKGLGTELVRQFSEFVFERHHASTIITDPAPENKRAIRCYEKAGFNLQGPVNTPDGQALLMEKKKQPTQKVRTTVIRRASAEDFMLARQAVMDVHERSPFADADLKAFLSDPSCYLLLAIEQSRVVGSLNGYALRHPNRRAPQFLLYEIDVREECRRNGVGNALVEAFSNEARTAGAFEMWVLTNNSNKAATTLYLKNGFKRTNSDDVMFSLSFEVEGSPKPS